MTDHTKLIELCRLEAKAKQALIDFGNENDPIHHDREEFWRLHRAFMSARTRREAEAETLLDAS